MKSLVPRMPWVVRGVIAGASGTAAMSLTYGVVRGLRPNVRGPLDYDDGPVPGRIVANLLHLPDLTSGQEHELALLVRWGFGSALGLYHGLLRRGLSEPWASAVFGATLMTATFTVFPVLGGTPPPWRWSPATLSTSLCTHAVYVTTVALVDNALR